MQALIHPVRSPVTPVTTSAYGEKGTHALGTLQTLSCIALLTPEPVENLWLSIALAVVGAVLFVFAVLGYWRDARRGK